MYKGIIIMDKLDILKAQLVYLTAMLSITEDENKFILEEGIEDIKTLLSRNPYELDFNCNITDGNTTAHIDLASLFSY